MQIFPLLSSQVTKELCEQINLFAPYCAGFHIDIMDGQFVQASLGSVELVHELRSITAMSLWIHLQVVDPIPLIEKLILQPQDIVTIHRETVTVQECEIIVRMLKEKNLRPSLALSPETSIAAFVQVAHLFEHVLIMSANPGAIGQCFFKNTYDKLRILQEWRLSQATFLTVAVGGGVNVEDIQKLADLEVSHFALEAAVWGNEKLLKFLQELKLTTK